jgi:hypothetical protein
MFRFEEAREQAIDLYEPRSGKFQTRGLTRGQTACYQIFNLRSKSLDRIDSMTSQEDG